MSLNKFSRPKGLTESQAVQKKSNRDYSQCRNPFLYFFASSFPIFGLVWNSQPSQLADRQIYSFLELQEEKLYFKEGEGKNMNY